MKKSKLLKFLFKILLNFILDILLYIFLIYKLILVKINFINKNKIKNHTQSNWIDTKSYKFSNTNFSSFELSILLFLIRKFPKEFLRRKKFNKRVSDFTYEMF
tara:strand:- start:4980 stop:5288 length:309 start_codon:yes stop_codon:yes gene_type:complete